MTQMLLPITLSTASLLTVICIVLIGRVGGGRFKHHVSLGDGGNHDMMVRIRTHANFIEYVPLILVMMGLLEMAGAHRLALSVIGGALILFRVLHAVGMPRKAPNIYRATGAIGTVLILAICAGYGLVLVALS